MELDCNDFYKGVKIAFALSSRSIPIHTGVKYSGSSHAPLASSHTSSYSFFMALRSCPDHDSCNTVAETCDSHIFLSLNLKLKN